MDGGYRWVQWGLLASLQAIFDRNRKDELPALQVEWIDGICRPLYQVRERRTSPPARGDLVGDQLVSPASLTDPAEAERQAAADGGGDGRQPQEVGGAVFSEGRSELRNTSQSSGVSGGQL